MAHYHASAAATHRGRLLAVLLIGVAILAIAVVGTILANSLALLADAGLAGLPDAAWVERALRR
jgi:cobalt-zinc-cadmium efflux system protein